MSSALGVAIIGALQGSLSVLLTILYGVIATRCGMITPPTIKDVSTLCANVFLPALLVATIGQSVNAENFLGYLPIFVWSLTYTLLSMALGRLVARWWKLPSWTVVAITFNNTTSLPLLLTRSFAHTGILSPITGDDPQKALGRATSYFLINSLVSKIATFALGPRLLDEDCVDPQGPEPLNGFVKVTETTALLPGYQKSQSSTSVPSIGQRVFSIFSPTTWGAIFAITIGVSPSLHRLFFAPPEEGGYLTVWVTGSLRNIGDLFAVLQVFVVSANLSKSFQTDAQVRPSNPPWRALIAIFAIRFIFWTVVSIPTIYFLATKTSLLSRDPMLWYSMMVMPVGPPAMILSALLEVIGAGQTGKLMVARTLAVMYGVTPVFSFAVAGSLKACELALKKSAESNL